MHTSFAEISHGLSFFLLSLLFIYQPSLLRLLLQNSSFNPTPLAHATFDKYILYMFRSKPLNAMLALTLLRLTGTSVWWPL
jgi:hypothetical protein